MKELTLDLNLDAEVEALAAFISQKWTPIGNITNLFTEIRDAALHAGRAWFDKHRVWEAASKMEDSRTAFLMAVTQAGSDAEYYDAYATLLSQIARGTDDAREAALLVDGKWDFERRTKQLTTAVLPKYPDLLGAKPLGWAELAENYCDFDGQAEYDPRPDRELFQGVKVQGTLCADFPGRVALPYVIYDETCQSMKAYHVLVGAVFAHFLGIAEYLNTNKLIEDLKMSVSAAVNTPEMLFERKVETSNPVLLFMLESVRPAPTEAEFAEAQASRAQWEALSEGEREVRRAENEKSVSALLSELLAKSNSDVGLDSYEQRQAARLEKAQRLSQLYSLSLAKV